MSRSSGSIRLSISVGYGGSNPSSRTKDHYSNHSSISRTRQRFDSSRPHQYDSLCGCSLVAERVISLILFVARLVLAVDRFPYKEEA